MRSDQHVRFRSCCLRLAVTFSVAASPAAADDSLAARGQFHVIVQVGPGTGVDIPARLYAGAIGRAWKQPVIVENRPGADGLIADRRRSPARTTTTRCCSVPAAPISVFPYLYDNLGYDPARDLVPISRGAETFVALTASAASQMNSLGELEGARTRSTAA